MNRYTITGLCLILGGLGAYVVGIAVTYPGRAFSITAVMIGVSLLAVGTGIGTETGGL